MRNVLISGIESLLGSHLAARCLHVTDDRVFCRLGANGRASEAEIYDLVSRAIRRFKDGDEMEACQPQSLTNRLLWVDQGVDLHSYRRTREGIDEVWYCATSSSGPRHLEIEGLISACSAIGAREFNYIDCEDANSDTAFRRNSLGGSTVDSGEGVSDCQISQWCTSQNVQYRTFRTALLLGHAHPAQTPSAFSQFLSVLHSFKVEIEERSPHYFDFHALRCLVPEGAVLNLITAAQASEILLHVARTDGTIGGSFSVADSQDTPLAVLCERIGVAYGLSLLPAKDFRDLNAIDRAFHERSGGGLGPLWGRNQQRGHRQIDSASLDEEVQIAFLESICRNQEEADAARKRKAANLPARLTRKTIARDGSELNYYVGGRGSQPVVLLNALGQGLEYWYRLIDRLMEDYTVIAWEPRGTVCPLPPFGLADQVDDVDAVLHHEGVVTCHLIGWCTGPKVAIDFYLRRPSMVTSMAFLNSTFKCDGSPEEFDSPYERSVESLCRMLVRKPSMGASVMKNLQSPPELNETELLNEPASEAMSVSVLSLMNINLRGYVVAPFKTEVTTVNYAHQLVDFWSHDSRAKAGDVQIPVLLVATEYDQVATPASSQMAAGLFPNARHVLVPVATHYCLYDQPDLVAGMLREFFENPDVFPATPRARDMMIQV